MLFARVWFVFVTVLHMHALVHANVCAVCEYMCVAVCMCRPDPSIPDMNQRQNLLSPRCVSSYDELLSRPGEFPIRPSLHPGSPLLPL